MSTDDPAGDGGDEQQPESREPPSELRTVPVGAFAVAVLVAVATTILAVVALVGGGDEGTSDTAPRTAAGRFAETLLTVSSETVEQWQAEITALASPAFRREFDDSVAERTALLGDEEFAAAGAVTEIFLTQVTDGTASAVVLYDLTITRADGPEVRRNQYLQVGLVRVDREWLVDSVIDLQFPAPTAGS